MGILGFGQRGEEGRGPVDPRQASREVQAREESERLQALRDEVRLRDEDRGLLLQALARLDPGQGAAASAELLFELSRKPLDLCTYYLALVDYEADQLRFVYYFEGGKTRHVRTPAYSLHGGLTVRALEDRQALYCPTQESQVDAGVVYSEAERITGLIPKSWYGVPLGLGRGWAPRPFGLVSFQSFQEDAFSPSRRALMDGLAAILALALKAAPGTAEAPPAADSGQEGPQDSA